jgi:hypothetical protein
MTIQIQTEQFELGDLYAYLNQQDLPEGITLEYSHKPKEGRGLEEEIFKILFKIGEIIWQEVLKEIVKFFFKKYAERASVKPHIEVTFKDGRVEQLPKSMGESMIAARLVEYASTGNLEKVEFN